MIEEINYDKIDIKTDLLNGSVIQLGGSLNKNLQCTLYKVIALGHEYKARARPVNAGICMAFKQRFLFVLRLPSGTTSGSDCQMISRGLNLDLNLNGTS